MCKTELSFIITHKQLSVESPAVCLTVEKIRLLVLPVPTSGVCSSSVQLCHPLKPAKALFNAYLISRGMCSCLEEKQGDGEGHSAGDAFAASAIIYRVKHHGQVFIYSSSIN